MTPRRIITFLFVWCALMWAILAVAVCSAETILLQVSQTGCGPCVTQRPLAAAAARSTGIRFAEHNITVSGNPWGVKTTPTMFVIEADASGDADVLGTLVGPVSQAALERLIRGVRR